MADSPFPAYKRVLLKLSGEALMGDQSYGIDPAVATQIARDVAEIQGLGVQTAIVIGGGNIFRGVAASARGMDRATADYMGLLATVIRLLTSANSPFTSLTSIVSSSDLIVCRAVLQGCPAAVAPTTLLRASPASQLLSLRPSPGSRSLHRRSHGGCCPASAS